MHGRGAQRRAGAGGRRAGLWRGKRGGMLDLYTSVVSGVLGKIGRGEGGSTYWSW